MFFETLIDKIYDYKNRVFRVLKSQSDSLIDIEISFGKRDDLKNITLDSLLLKDEKSISILFKNCRFIGAESISLDYSGSEPIAYSVSVLPESYEIKKRGINGN